MLAGELPVSLVLADRECRGITLGEEAGIPTTLLERSEWGETFDRDAYASELVTVLGEHDIDLVAMAGFGTILGEPIFAAMPGHIINTHPALLPSFPGWHAVRDALSFGVKVTGCTIHVATAEVDHGPIVAQEAVRIFDDDDETSLHERIKAVERRLYVDTLRRIVESGQLLGNPI
jgi:phosphoribosylglycinamide formyltransferase-1